MRDCYAEQMETKKLATIVGCHFVYFDLIQGLYAYICPNFIGIGQGVC